MKTFLHVGCGLAQKAQTTPGFNTPEWEEMRFDIDEAVEPDIVGSMIDMKAIADQSVDAIFSSHNIEHLYPYEVPLALAEFFRVLKPTGFAVITYSDLQSVCALIALNQLTDVAYHSPMGPITPLDILYGHRDSIQQGNVYMAHRCGFTKDVLNQALSQAGFASGITFARPQYFDLWAFVSKQEVPYPDLAAIVQNHGFP